MAASSEVFAMGFSIGLGVLGIGAPYACIAFLALVMNKGGEDRKWANGATRNRGLNWKFQIQMMSRSSSVIKDQAAKLTKSEKF